MVVFPNAKINIGLDIVERRSDGYHNIVTLFYPVGWCDVLEIVPGKRRETTLTITGREVACPMEKNLIIKALRALDENISKAAGATAAEGWRHLPPLDIFLHKVIPDGAGLGGGSADAAFAVRAVNDMMNLGLTEPQMAEIIAPVGADCPFFIYNRPMLATGTGTTLSPAELSLEGYYITIAKPDVSVPTREAYAGVTPRQPDTALERLLNADPASWSAGVKNDFEASIFPSHPEIAAIKKLLMEHGAVYASMSGSGSAVYGIFTSDILAETAAAKLADCQTFTCAMQ